MLVIVGLGFFGVGVDLIHQMVVHFAEHYPSVGLLKHVFALIEDSGEMLVASVAVALTLAPPLTSTQPEPARGRDARLQGRAT